MLHPPSGRVQQASRDAFERVWQYQGWMLFPGSDPSPVETQLQPGERVLSRQQVETLDEATVAPEPPASRDSKAVWVEWAVANGADRAEAEAMTKKDLIAAFGE